eukprot:tig00000057_g110.t1
MVRAGNGLAIDRCRTSENAFETQTLRAPPPIPGPLPPPRHPIPLPSPSFPSLPLPLVNVPPELRGERRPPFFSRHTFHVAFSSLFAEYRHGGLGFLFAFWDSLLKNIFTAIVIGVMTSEESGSALAAGQTAAALAIIGLENAWILLGRPLRERGSNLVLFLLNAADISIIALLRRASPSIYFQFTFNSLLFTLPAQASLLSAEEAEASSLVDAAVAVNFAKSAFVLLVQLVASWSTLAALSRKAAVLLRLRRRSTSESRPELRGADRDLDREAAEWGPRKRAPMSISMPPPLALAHDREDLRSRPRRGSASQPQPLAPERRTRSSAGPKAPAGPRPGGAAEDPRPEPSPKGFASVAGAGAGSGAGRVGARAPSPEVEEEAEAPRPAPPFGSPEEGIGLGRAAVAEPPAPRWVRVVEDGYVSNMASRFFIV